MTKQDVLTELREKTESMPYIVIGLFSSKEVYFSFEDGSEFLTTWEAIKILDKLTLSQENLMALKNFKEKSDDSEGTHNMSILPNFKRSKKLKIAFLRREVKKLWEYYLGNYT